MGAGLAALAIETRRLYSDLLHRSEFDLLTDIHNRFSLEKHLDALIDEARQTAGIFGLIYIDLDEFKQVNDQYGHQVGDLYLQEVAVRMKQPAAARRHAGAAGRRRVCRAGSDGAQPLRTLRRSLLRLERCFDEPFAVAGLCDCMARQAWASPSTPRTPSPETACCDAADAAMYKAKNAQNGKARTLRPAES